MRNDIDWSECRLSTANGEFQLFGFKEPETGLEHAALCHGSWTGEEPVLVRLHSECLTGDAFWSCHCDCGPQLRSALHTIVKEGQGALLYLRQEGRGIGLLNKIRAYALQEKGADTLDANRMLGLPADARTYGFAALMLQHLRIGSVKLMTNNPDKVDGLTAHGINVVERVPLQVGRNRRNEAYLDTKAHRMGHIFDDLLATTADT